MSQREVWREEQQSWELATCSVTEVFAFIIYFTGLFLPFLGSLGQIPQFESLSVFVFLSLYITMDLKYHFKGNPAVLCF